MHDSQAIRPSTDSRPSADGLGPQLAPNKAAVFGAVVFGVLVFGVLVFGAVVFGVLVFEVVWSWSGGFGAVFGVVGVSGGIFGWQP